LTLKNRIENSIPGQEDQTILEHLVRLLKIITYAESVFSLIEPESSPESTLVQINKICSNIETDLNNFENDKKVAHLSTANTPRADNILINLQQLPKTITNIDVDVKNIEISQLYKSTTNIISEITKEKVRFKEKLEDYKKEITQLEKNITIQNQNIESQKSRLDTAISQFQTQFSEAEDRRRESFDINISKSNEEFTNFRTTIQNEMSSFKNEQIKEVASSKIKFFENAENTLSSFKVDSENAVKNLKDDTIAIIEFLSEKKDDASKLLNIIANIGSTGNYDKIANKERLAANILRLLAILFMVAGIGVISAVVFNFSNTAFDLKILLSRLVLIVATLSQGYVMLFYLYRIR